MSLAVAPDLLIPRSESMVGAVSVSAVRGGGQRPAVVGRRSAAGATDRPSGRRFIRMGGVDSALLEV
ncbi:hypothetical protein ACWGJX_47885, partial [Streptomyces sp. NPDC054775]